MADNDKLAWNRFLMRELSSYENLERLSLEQISDLEISLNTFDLTEERTQEFTRRLRRFKNESRIFPDQDLTNTFLKVRKNKKNSPPSLQPQLLHPYINNQPLANEKIIPLPTKPIPTYSISQEQRPIQQSSLTDLESIAGIHERNYILQQTAENLEKFENTLKDMTPKQLTSFKLRFENIMDRLAGEGHTLNKKNTDRLIGLYSEVLSKKQRNEPQPQSAPFIYQAPDTLLDEIIIEPPIGELDASYKGTGTIILEALLSPFAYVSKKLGHLFITPDNKDIEDLKRRNTNLETQILNTLTRIQEIEEQHKKFATTLQSQEQSVHLISTNIENIKELAKTAVESAVYTTEQKQELQTFKTNIISEVEKLTTQVHKISQEVENIRHEELQKTLDVQPNTSYTKRVALAAALATPVALATTIYFSPMKLLSDFIPEKQPIYETVEEGRLEKGFRKNQITYRVEKNTNRSYYFNPYAKRDGTLSERIQEFTDQDGDGMVDAAKILYEHSEGIVQVDDALYHHVVQATETIKTKVQKK